MNDRRFPHALLVIVLVVSLSCSLPAAVSAPQVPAAPVEHTSAPPAQGLNPVPAAAGSATPPPLVATILASSHALTPADTGVSGSLNYDVDSSGTGPEHRAPYGDSYNINLFERPFTQNDMTYLPHLDISTFQLAQDPTWDYVSIDLIGGDMNDPAGINYGVELDVDHDGYGDYLVWAEPPYAPQWLAETVRVLQDSNHDTGGPSAEKSDAPYQGNGYDKVVFDRGNGEDPDLAWVRLNPGVTAAIQFAFKRSLAGGAFMWGVWADSGLRDPSQFNYNDRYTEEQAGSPEKSEKHYPIKAIYQVDNTCWAAVGFEPTGYEAHLCPSLQAQPTKRKAQPTAGPACPPGSICLNQLFFQFHVAPEGIPAAPCLPAGTRIDTPSGSTPIENLRVGDEVWSADEHGARIAATIIQTSRTAVLPGHALVHMLLADGRELWGSPGHPTADGRMFGAIRTGDTLDGALVSSAEVLPSNLTSTYDVLPSGPTGFYWANEILVGSTLGEP